MANNNFIVVGENIHATRSLKLTGKRITNTEDGGQYINYIDNFKNTQLMQIPQWFKNTQPYSQGQIKHFMIAITNLRDNDPNIRLEGEKYIKTEVEKQIKSGANYIDINVDEVHYDLNIQKDCMNKAVKIIQKYSSVPISIDSSNSEIIESGLKACTNSKLQPIINSVAFERPEVFDMAMEYKTKIIAMATNESGMPEDSKDRIDNSAKIIDKATSLGFSLKDIFLDAIIFPISVNSQYGNHYFDAVKEIRKQYGKELYIGMGLSNVSFGMPMRKLINQAFIYLGLESGINAGLLDPIQIKLNEIQDIDINSKKFILAINMLTGKDEFCMNYLKAYRDGELN
ncbi:MAG: hypothetical protein CL758_02660 [Chloroflexi bacterium]|nr:hypothetical protein [Chloroflexota bacterium]|tara:strand:+ start:40494 stop:41519 length:1026 start_codon:yes stop_codon:yes gene_type:complete